MSNRKNLVLNTDSYKNTMHLQYPPGTEYVYSYVEARGGIFEQTVFFGLQAVIKEYLLTPITQEQIDFADKVWAAHGMSFNRAGWEYILKEHNGLIPVKIRAVKEGTVVPVKNILCTIENTDKNVPWVTTWIETLILRALWYGTTVATLSWNMKQVIKSYLEKSGDVTGLGYKLHDFGARGVSSFESAELGGAAHLVNFMGSDTICALPYLMELYNAPIDTICHSVPAAEHSTITSWGKDHEVDAYRNMVTQFGKPGAIFAVVSDSYDIYQACEYWGTVLKDEVINSGATLVIRPDSGDPLDVLPKMFNRLEKYFGYTVNAKGYKVLNNVRVIWGDGIDRIALSSILRVLVDTRRWSADNISFGMGGGLLQKVDRDMQKWALKCSAVKINGEWVDVFKDPITDPGKTSKKGRVTLFESDGHYISGIDGNAPKNLSDKSTPWKDCLVTYYENGVLKIDQTLAEIRWRANA